MSISMKNVSERDLRKLQKKGYAVSEVKKPEVKPEEQTVKELRAIEVSLGIFRERYAENVEATEKIWKTNTDAIVEALGKETPKKKFELIPERNKQGYIQKITIREI
jgi:hypothetical protein